VRRVGGLIISFTVVVVNRDMTSAKQDQQLGIAAPTASNRTYSNPKTVIPLFVPIYSFPFTIISWAKCGIGGKVSRPFVCDVAYNWTRVVAL